MGRDGSPTAARPLDRAAEVAGVTGASLAVVPRRVGPGAERLVADAVEALASCRSTRRSSPVTLHAARGPSVPRHDLLVVGNTGMTETSPFLLGPVQNKVSHHMACPSLIVRTT